MNHQSSSLQLHNVASPAKPSQHSSIMNTPILPRVVAVTGMGAVTPLGLTLVDSWHALLQQASGSTSLQQALLEHQGLPEVLQQEEWQIAQDLPCQVVAPVKGFISSSTSTKSLSADFGKRSTARFIEFALQAADEAVKQAGLDDYLQQITDKQRARIGVSIGSGMSAVREIGQAYRQLALTPEQQADNHGTPQPRRRPYRRLSPHFVPKVLPNSAAGRVSMQYQGLWGPNLAPSTACAAGAHAIGQAWQAIQTGQADVMLAGGSEAAVDPLSLAGFCQLRALATDFNDQPALASRPFDDRRSGFVLAEGSAVLVLEEWQHALQRGYQGPPLAFLTGYGASGDGFHVTAPDPAGRGARQAMASALTTAQVEAAHVQYVNAHATSTPKGDEIEAQAIAELLGSAHGRDSPVYVSSTKGSTGHLLGAAGALEAAFTVQSLVHQTLPGTLNLENMEHEIELGDSVQFLRQTQGLSTGTLTAALSNSFGFGGVNASLLFQSKDFH